MCELNVLEISFSERFPAEFCDQLASLVDNICIEIHSRATTGQLLARRLNISLGFFLRDLFVFMDRGFVMNLVQRRVCMTDMRASSVLSEFKLDFLRIICVSEQVRGN